MRLILFLATLALSGAVFAQAIDVQRLAPQLVAFAGGDANFQNLVNGLATGTAVTLTTVAPGGGTQVVTFTPTGTMTAQQIAQTLESLRQSLISRGIAAPSAQQLATALTGGPLVTPSGSVQVGGVVTATQSAPVQQQSAAVQIQNTFSNAAAGASTAIRSQTSDSPFPRGISDTPSNAGMVPQTPAPGATPQGAVTPETARVTPQSTVPPSAPQARDR